jgi:hypothetical protein
LEDGTEDREGSNQCQFLEAKGRNRRLENAGLTPTFASIIV